VSSGFRQFSSENINDKQAVEKGSPASLRCSIAEGRLE
jgi:hypothetical protein